MTFNPSARDKTPVEKPERPEKPEGKNDDEPHTGGGVFPESPEPVVTIEVKLPLQ